MLTEFDAKNIGDRIAFAVQEQMTWAYYDGPHPGDIAYEQRSAETADRILTIIRTALLSEPAVDAAMAVVEYRNRGPFSAQEWKEEIEDWHEAFSAAWDSVMGGGSSE